MPNPVLPVNKLLMTSILVCFFMYIARCNNDGNPPPKLLMAPIKSLWKQDRWT